MDTGSSYDRVVEEYTARIFGELEHKPFDRELLDRLVERCHGLGPICDLGCGPGHVARYLRERGAPALGVDLSPGMVDQARQLNPGVEFSQGDMRHLEVPDEAWGGIAAFYSVIHVPRDQITAMFGELRRVLQPGGWLLVAVHVGDHVVHLDEWWGQPVNLDFRFFRREELEGCLRSAGFLIEESLERPPYPDVEHQSRRAYIFARKPGQGE